MFRVWEWSDGNGIIVVFEASPNKSDNISRSGIGYVFAARYMVPSDVFSTMVVIGAICVSQACYYGWYFQKKVTESNRDT